MKFGGDLTKLQYFLSDIVFTVFKTDANNFTARAVKLFVHIDASQHHQRMTCAKDRLNPSAGSDDPWHTSSLSHHF